MNVSSEILIQHEELLNLLSNVQTGLLSVSENAEDDFLQLGQQLQTGYTSVSKLAELAFSAAKTTETDSDKNDFTNATYSVNKALTDLKIRRELVESKLPPVRKVVDYLDDLNSKRDEIEMIAKYLRAVALNIFIETARSEVSNKNFSIIAEEIKELSESIIDMAKSIRDDSENAKNRFKDMFSNIATGIKTMNSVTTEAEDSVHNSIQSIEHLMELSHQSVKQAEEMSREISKQVGNIVVGVQFHDDMRQRLEHIVSALSKVEPLCDEIKQNNPEPDEQQLAVAHSILTVQKAQVKGIIAELDNIYQKNRDSFEKIIIEIEQLVQILAQDSGQNLGDSDIFSNLSMALLEFQNLDNQGVDLVRQLEETYQQASVTTDALSLQANKIHEISRDSHIKALNAIIATQNMGFEGNTLLTLAGEMKTLSYQAENFVTDVSSIIESIIQTVKTVNIHDDTLNNDSESDDAERPDLNGIVINITVLCAQMQNNSEIIYKQSEELSLGLTEAKNNLDFFPVIGSKLNQQLESLDKALEILSPWAAAEGDPLNDSLANQLYTMEKERKIHEQALDVFSEDMEASVADVTFSDDDKADESATEGMNENEAQEFDDNVELF